MQTLNDRQLAFAEAYALGGPDCQGNAAASALRAGYPEGCARQTGYRLLRHDGVRAEIDRLNRQAIKEYATASIHLLGRVVTDERAPLKLRIDSAKTLLDRGGYIAPKAPDAPELPSDKQVETMSVGDLERLVIQLRQLEAREAQTIDVTPANAPATVPALPAQ